VDLPTRPRRPVAALGRAADLIGCGTFNGCGAQECRTAVHRSAERCRWDTHLVSPHEALAECGIAALRKGCPQISFRFVRAAVLSCFFHRISVFNVSLTRARKWLGQFRNIVAKK
jgi:hypothetical protein